MFTFVRLTFCCAVLALAACGPADDDGMNPDDPPGDLPDADGDGIADEHEGRGSNLDTDMDGTPDYLDDDSDGDGIPDYREAGDELTGTPPIDTDADGTPDFQDLDSDDNGIDDATDGVEDIDGDGKGNFQDLDDDDDSLLDTFEIDGNPSDPPDTDGDGTPNFQDIDSDADNILDRHERAGDPDNDGLPAYIDPDADGDCINDTFEAGDTDLQTPPIDSDGDLQPNFLDLDSDNDGLSDGAEDANCNGSQDGTETSTTDEDSDGDGVTDLVEVAAGTDPLDNGDNPQANGDFVFFEPYQAAPSPPEDKLDFSTSFQAVDVYILEDVSGSMGDEVTSVRNGLITMINEITCQAGEDPATAYCIPDLETGAGRFGKTSETWAHLKDINSNHTATQNALPSTVAGGGEQHIKAMDSALKGTCGSDASRTGVACFRPGSLQVMVVISDEDFREDNWYGTANANNVYANMVSLGTRVIGVTGNDDYGELASLRSDFLGMSSGGTNIVPAITTTPSTTQCNALGGSPFYSNRAIVSGPNAQAGNALTCALQAITAFLPQDVGSLLVNDPSNMDSTGTPVDAITAFVDHIEVFQDGSPECSDGNSVTDTNGDTYADTYTAILPGTPVCWKLFVKQNDTVMPSTEPQMFRATVEVYGEGGALLDERDVFFLVPPEIPDVPID